MTRWIRFIVIGFVATAVVSYAGDWLMFNLRGSITSKVTVSHFLSAPLKNNKQELDYLGSEEVPCSVSLFPQGGHTPCWYLRRHTNQTTTI
jgi:hypothetical protein